MSTNRHAHADELAVSLLRLGTLRVTLTDFTESLSLSTALWDHLDPMTKTRALQLHDTLNLIGEDLDQIKGRVNDVIDRPRLVHNHDIDPSCPEYVRGGRLLGECMITADDEGDNW